MMKIKVFRAADAFLYLPTYIAEETGIFDTLITNCEVEFKTPDTPSDLEALKHMLQENTSDSEDIAFAICDPLVFFSTGIKAELKDQCVIVGALIDKLPFWAVNHRNELMTVENFKQHFKEVIYYDERFVTGNYLGKEVSKIANLGKIPVGFGEEIEKLKTLNTEALKNRNLNQSASRVPAVAITADIVSLAQHFNTDIDDDRVTITHHFSVWKKYLTTGIITHKKVCDEHPEKVAKFLEGIQKAIFILRSSKKMAIKVCSDIAEKDEFYTKKQRIKKLGQKEINWIVETIRKEDFYPANLSIERSDWDVVVEARGIIDGWNREEVEEYKALFDNHVDNGFLNISKTSIATEFGIDAELFVANNTKEEIADRFDITQELFYGNKSKIDIANEFEINETFFETIKPTWKKIINLMFLNRVSGYIKFATIVLFPLLVLWCSDDNLGTILLNSFGEEKIEKTNLLYGLKSDWFFAFLYLSIALLQLLLIKRVNKKSLAFPAILTILFIITYCLQIQWVKDNPFVFVLLIVIAYPLAEATGPYFEKKLREWGML